MDQSRETSPTTFQESQDCVMIADDPNNQGETMEGSTNTQAVLDIEMETRKTKGKGIGKKTGKAAKVKVIQNHPFTKWLESMWQSEITLRVMKPWLQVIQKESMKTQNMKLYKVGTNIQKIVKEFILWLKENQKNLMNCSYVLFEDWYSNDGLSMIYGKYQAMDWEDGFENVLFILYSTCVMELEVRQKEQESSDEEPPISSLSHSMKNISTSSTTAHIPVPHVDVSTSKGCVSTPLNVSIQKNLIDGKTRKRVQFQKEKFASKMRKLMNDEETNDNYIQPGSLFKAVQMNPKRS